MALMFDRTSVMASPRIWPRLVLRSRPRWFHPRRFDSARSTSRSSAFPSDDIPGQRHDSTGAFELLREPWVASVGLCEEVISAWRVVGVDLDLLGSRDASRARSA